MRTRYWSSACKSKPWLMRLCGLICKPSTASRGADAWILSVRATRASRSASPVSVVARTMTDTFGRKSLESLARSNRVCAFSRMCPAISLWGLMRSPMTLSDWVTDLRLVCLRRQRLAQATSESGCSSWPTAKANDAEKRGNVSATKYPELVSAAQQWITPTVNNQTRVNNGTGPSLTTQSTNWPTAGTNDHKGTAKLGQRRGQLDEAAEQVWSTPIAHNASHNASDKSGNNSDLARDAQIFHSSRPVQPNTTDGGESSKQTRRLNPRFVEWLMGWPIGWTDCDSPATGLCRYRRRMRSQLFGLVCTTEQETP